MILATRPSPAALAPAHPRLRAAARLAYVVIILFATLPGTGWSTSPLLVRLRLERALHPGFSAIDVVDGVRNVVLFAGLGVVWIATTRTRRLWPPVWRAAGAGLLVSLVVETVQLTSPSRFASVLDLATNALGAFLGALAAATVVRFTRWELERGSSEMPLLLAAASYLGAATLEAFSPWGRQDRVPDAWGGPGRRLAAALAWLRASPPGNPSLGDVALFAPAGAVAAAALLAYGWRPARAAVAATLLCALSFAVAELARGASGGDLRPRAFAARAVAAAIGAILVAATRARRAPLAPVPDAGRTSARLAAATVALLACWYWRPFALVDSLVPTAGRDNLVPLRALRQLFNLYSVADVGVDFLLYFPVGVWLAVRPLRRGGAFGGVVPGLWLALLLETGQLWIRGRTFDVTDVLVQWAGVLIAAAVVRQARLRQLRDRRRRG